ncbi:MAG: hypothetical protein ACLFPA_07625, partial [Dichotomicrobium sp.]
AATMPARPARPIRATTPPVPVDPGPTAECPQIDAGTGETLAALTLALLRGDVALSFQRLQLLTRIKESLAVLAISFDDDGWAHAETAVARTPRPVVWTNAHFLILNHSIPGGL